MQEQFNYTQFHGLDRQKAYLQQTVAHGVNANSFFKIDKVVESMRDSGYRDIRKALNDIMDNSIQAGSEKIAVVTTTGREERKGSREKITNIAVIDDGHGMYPEMLRVAVSWGGTDRHNVREGLGRFGFGLPTAAVSVTRVYEVYSKVDGGEWYKVRVDLDEIAQKSLSGSSEASNVPPFTQAQPPEFIFEKINEIWDKEDLAHGTVVLLVNPDRIRSFSLPQTFETKMLQNIGLTYRHFIRNCHFFVQSRKVSLIDPTFTNPNGIGYDVGNGYIAEGLDDLSFEVRHQRDNDEIVTGNVNLKFSFMHPRFQRDPKGKLIQQRFEVMKENNGYFIVCRNGRQIDVVTKPNYQSETDNTTIINYDRNWTIELDFDPVLDELFGITTNKQQVELDSKLWDIFKAQGIPNIVKGFRDKLNALRTDDENNESTTDAPKDSETVMDEADKFDGLKLPKDKQEDANEKVKKEAREEAERTGELEEDVIRRFEDEANRRKYKVEYTKLQGAPFYDVEQWGTQTKIKINIRHRFYTDVYSTLDERGRTAIELLIFVLGKCEIEASGDLLEFYLSERYEWSRKLDTRLRLLDKRDPIIDKKSSDEEENELLEFQSL